MKSQDDAQVMFGERLRELRLKAGLSQEALADLAGIHRNYLGESERGLRNVSLKNIIKIAAALKVHPTKLFTKF
jgi:transcriptional regulator with XRE-family HTH domain